LPAAVKSILPLNALRMTSELIISNDRENNKSWHNGFTASDTPLEAKYTKTNKK